MCKCVQEAKERAENGEEEDSQALDESEEMDDVEEEDDDIPLKPFTKVRLIEFSKC